MSQVVDPPPTRSQWVAERLRRAILTGELRPGERLVTTALASEWSVSPTPLREALRLLASEGLVEMSPQRSARVAPVSFRDFAEICEIRFLLEPFALRRSLQSRTDAWVEQTEKALDQLSRVAQDEPLEPTQFETAHDAFHRELLSLCGSARLLETIDAMAERSTRHRLLSLAGRGSVEDVLAEHEHLLKLCADDDVEAAVDALERHLMRTVELVLGDRQAAAEATRGLTAIPAAVERSGP